MRCSSFLGHDGLEFSGLCPTPLVWTAGRWSFPAWSRRRTGCVVGIVHGVRDAVSDCAMRSVLNVMSTPSLQLFAGVGKTHEPVGVQAFRAQLTVEREAGSGKAPVGRFPHRTMKPFSVGLPGREKPKFTALA